MRASVTVPLSVAVEFINGDRGKNYPDRDAQKPNGYCLFLNTKNVRQGHFDFTNLSFIDEKRHKKLGEGSLRRNDIVITIRGTLGNTAIYKSDIPFDVVRINSAMLALRPRKHFDPDFIERYLRSSEFLNWVGLNQRGSAQPHLRTLDIETAEIPLLSLVQQRRIVAKIDSLTARSKRARDHLDHIPRLVEKYKQAVLAAAFRGDLSRAISTGERGEPWPKTTLGAVVAIASGQTPKGIEEALARDGEIHWFKVSSMNEAENLQGLKSSQFRLSVSSAKALGLRIVPAGSIAFPKRGGAIATNKKRRLLVDCALDLNLMVLTPKGISSDFLWWWLQALDLSTISNGSNVPQINNGDIAPLPISVPPASEQFEIARRIETAFTWIDRLATEATSARNLVDKLDQAVLAKAFRGELVPQDPNDEPTRVLLDRIRAEQAVAPKARRGRKPRLA